MSLLESLGWRVAPYVLIGLALLVGCAGFWPASMWLCVIACVVRWGGR